MTELGFPVFDATVQKTSHLLKHIEGAYGWPKQRRNQSYAALRSVLQTLRDRLTVEETAQLAAQLPMLVRGLYYEGWNPTVVPVDMDRAEFLAAGAGRLRLPVRRWTPPAGPHRRRRPEAPRERGRVGGHPVLDASRPGRGPDLRLAT